MKTYIILLRGINVSGKNKLPMADLRELLNDLKFENVQTYIQSGNVILDSEESKTRVCSLIKEGISSKFGYDVPVIARTVKEWENVVENYPFPIDNPKIVAFVFLDKTSEFSEIEIKNIGDDKFKIDKDMVYFYCPNGFGKSKITNNLFENKLKVTATTRNYNTTIKLLDLAKGK